MLTLMWDFYIHIKEYIVFLINMNFLGFILCKYRRCGISGFAGYVRIRISRINIETREEWEEKK